VFGEGGQVIAAPPPAWELPQSYSVTAAYMVLRAAEMFGVDPEHALASWRTGTRVLLADYVRLRSAEMARDRAAAAAALHLRGL